MVYVETQWRGAKFGLGAGMFAVVQRRMWRRRLLSVAASSPTHGEQLYTGRLSDAVRKLKLLSVSSCAVTVVTSPLFLLLESAASPGIRAAMSAMCESFAIGLGQAQLLSEICGY